MKLKARLGVNVDHVATVRQARGEFYPQVLNAAKAALEQGADQITIHLREDRRHIQDFDIAPLHELTKSLGKLLNFELGANDDIIQVALKTKPDWICLVPEKREEKTTEGGLNLKDPDNFERIKWAIKLFRSESPLTKISLFVESDEKTLSLCKELKVDAVEIHTGEYAKAFLDKTDYHSYLDSFKKSKKLCQELSIAFHAGHGLTDESLIPLVEANLFEEYNIGHWIISDSIFCGIANSVKKLINILRN